MKLLKQSAATDIKAGPFIDDTDFKTLETGQSITQSDVLLSKGNSGGYAQKDNASAAVSDVSGKYDIPLSITDVSTLGIFRVAVNLSGVLPYDDEFTVVPANIYDSLISGTDLLDVTVPDLVSVASDVTEIVSALGVVDTA
ncbi:MAG: hypothetical protein DRP42_07765, partial [Tenericutes bacterium]